MLHHEPVARIAKVHDLLLGLVLGPCHWGGLGFYRDAHNQTWQYLRTQVHDSTKPRHHVTSHLRHSAILPRFLWLGVSDRLEIRRAAVDGEILESVLELLVIRMALHNAVMVGGGWWMKFGGPAMIESAANPRQSVAAK